MLTCSIVVLVHMVIELVLKGWDFKQPLTVTVCFPGMEVAAYLAEKAHSVSVVSQEDIPFRKALGEKVGRAIMKVTFTFVTRSSGKHL